MANESVTESTDAKSVAHCKHDTEMVNEVNARLLKMRAVVDLMMCSDGLSFMKDTLPNIGWLLLEMIDETKAIVNEKAEVTA